MAKPNTRKEYRYEYLFIRYSVDKFKILSAYRGIYMSLSICVYVCVMMMNKYDMIFL